jgi:anti-sigma28 factor (negative regulator of flagellin synthesis)
MEPRDPKDPLVTSEANKEARMSALREQIERGEYAVDPKAVADAILRRMAAGLGAAQNRCS